MLASALRQDRDLKKNARGTVRFPLATGVAVCTVATAILGLASVHLSRTAAVPSSPNAFALRIAGKRSTNPRLFLPMKVTMVFRAPVVERRHARQTIARRSCLRHSWCPSRFATSNAAKRAIGVPSFDPLAIAVLTGNASQTGGSKRGRKTKMVGAFDITRLDVDGIAVMADLTRPPNQQTSNRDARNDLADDAVAVETGLGQVKSVATAGTLNGAPAAGLKLSLAKGPVLFDAGGVADMTSLSDPSGLRKTFKVSTSASLPFY